MKYLKKHLPTKTDLKTFYNINDTRTFTVKKITYVKDRILIDAKQRDNKTLYLPFYMDVNFINFDKRTFLISIEKKYFAHVIKNVKENLEYLKTL